MYILFTIKRCLQNSHNVSSHATFHYQTELLDCHSSCREFMSVQDLFAYSNLLQCINLTHVYLVLALTEASLPPHALPLLPVCAHSLTCICTLSYLYMYTLTCICILSYLCMHSLSPVYAHSLNCICTLSHLYMHTLLLFTLDCMTFPSSLPPLFYSLPPLFHSLPPLFPSLPPLFPSLPPLFLSLPPPLFISCINLYHAQCI